MAGPVAITGLAAEARIARAAGFATIVGGGDRARTAALVRQAATAASCLVSFGIAGGLAPGLAAGTVILSGEVVGVEGRWVAEDGLRRRLGALAQAIGAAEGRVLGAATILATRAAKAQAQAASGAVAVDLESDIVAAAAAAAGLPFIVLRAVADAADCDLPPAALIPLSSDGTPRLGAVLAGLARHPGQLAALVRLAGATRVALRALVVPAGRLRGLAAGL